MTGENTKTLYLDVFQQTARGGTANRADAHSAASPDNAGEAAA
jgi:hypothetical protein